jgi:hypothetical protein
MVTVVYIGKHAEITSTVERLLNGIPDIEGRTALNLEQLNEIVSDYQVNLILLGNGLSEEEETEVKNRYPDIKIIDHYGGGSGLLFGEIMEALK